MFDIHATPGCLRLLLCLFGLVVQACLVQAEVALPRLFGDNMVLQRECPVSIWGSASPGEKVTVEFGGQTRSAVADATGRWSLRLKALKSCATPAELVVAGVNRIVLTNILVGDVWLCSGQSNMEKPIGPRQGQKPVRNFERELAGADRPLIRLFKVEKAMAASPANDVKGSWRPCNSNSLETIKFSAVAYFFAREVQQNVQVPIGLIESAWGGTRVEPWTAPVGFESIPSLADLARTVPAGATLSNTMPSVLFNGMIAPLVPFALRGALWYQGESNCIDRPDGPCYTDKMEALIKGWRRVWSQGRFPFYYVQLAPYHYYYEREKPRVPTPDALPEMWEAQTAALRIPNTGMAVITDLVDDLKDIHPVQKQEVGQRLAFIALAKDYGQKHVAWSGPMFKRMKVRGNQVVLSFKHTEGGLASKDGQPLTWFTIAGADGRFVPAEAAIAGNTVVVSSSAVASPKAVRFAWHEGARPNLMNGAGLPACPFRTDSSKR